MNFISMRSTYIKLLSLIIAFFGGANSVFATHVACADLNVRYVGNGPNDLRYYVKLTLYKACEVGSTVLTPFDGNVTVTPYNCANASGLNLSLPQRSIDTLDQLCAQFSAINSCRVPNSPWPAFERRIYADTITLNQQCADWRFSFSLCCRNGGIVNLANPLGNSIYIEAKLNNLVRYNNSTPEFTQNPLPYICVNNPALYLNSPIDVDNDSILVVNTDPLTVGPAVIGYSPGFSLANPISSSTPFAVDANNGLATFTPSALGKYVLAFRCYDIDKLTGDTLGYVTRDVQILVLQCSAPPPQIDSFVVSANQCAFVPNPPFGGYIITCPGANMSFDVKSKSLSNSNAVFLSATNNVTIPGSTFSVPVQGQATTTGTFSWNPTVSDIGDHYFYAIAIDSTCTATQPIVLTTYYLFTVRVITDVSAGPDGKICGLNGVPWQLAASPAFIPYTWTDISGGPAIGLDNPYVYNPKAYVQYPPTNQTYVVNAPTLPQNAGCKVRDTVTVAIDTSNNVKVAQRDILLCRPGYVQLDATPIGGKPTARLECGLSNFPICAVPDTATISSFYNAGIAIPSDTVSPFAGDRRTARTQFLLTKNDLYAYGLNMGTINSIAFNVITPTATQFQNFSISLKCTDRPELSQATGGFEPGTVPVYTATSPVVLTPGWNTFNFTKFYDWDSTKGLIVEVCYSNIANGIAPTMSNVVTNSFQTITSFSTVGSGNICQNPTIASTTRQHFQRPIIRFTFCPAPETDFKFNWAQGTFLSDSTTKSPLAYIAESIKYAVFTQGRNGCIVSDTVSITIPEHNYQIAPLDTSICFGQSFGLRTVNENANVEWFNADYSSPASTLSCVNCTNPIATPTESGKYIAVFSDPTNCKDTLSMNVEVRPLPAVNILNADTTIKYGQTVQLLVAGAYLYTWSPVSTLSNPNIVNPIASPTEPVTYTVIGLADNGCRSLDTVRINIDYRDNLFVPSAFSPNGDDNNDIFYVSNITFQKLQEFRIFNRWGQELFRTNNPKVGWDGTWKGVAQDMGTYQYIIRVAYPDGFVETYKGDVTLVR
jgi:gliding motility-associated-like protein